MKLNEKSVIVRFATIFGWNHYRRSDLCSLIRCLIAGLILSAGCLYIASVCTAFFVVGLLQIYARLTAGIPMTEGGQGIANALMIGCIMVFAAGCLFMHIEHGWFVIKTTNRKQ